MFFKNPVYDWKNLTDNPNVIIRRDIMKVASAVPELKAAIDKIREHGRSLEKAITQIGGLDIKIKSKVLELKKAKSDKIKDKLGKEVKSLMQKKDSIVRKHKGVESDFLKKAADIFLEFDEVIDILYSLNMQPLTLIHKARKDIDGLIDKVKSLKHAQQVELEKLKVQSIAVLNREKEHLKNIAGSLYRSSGFQESGQFNPAELTNEMSFNGTPLKCRRVKQLTIEIDNVEENIQDVMKSIQLPQIPKFAETELSVQLNDFHTLAHHIKILTHRFHQILNQCPKNKKLKNKLHKRLRDIVKQTRLLWNSITVEQYRPKILRFRKPEELVEMRKAA